MIVRKLSIALLAVSLAGCASVPQPKPQTQRSYTAPAKIVQPAPVEATTPNQIVKKRWYDRFKIHPKLFHG